MAGGRLLLSWADNSGCQKSTMRPRRSSLPQIGGRLCLSWAGNSGCQKSTMRTRRSSVPSCHTSCSNESSNMMNLPSCHVLTEGETYAIQHSSLCLYGLSLTDCRKTALLKNIIFQQMVYTMSMFLKKKLHYPKNVCTVETVIATV